MATTLQQLRDIGYAILREDESTTGAYPTVLMDLLLNSAQQSVCNGNIQNPITKESVTKGQLPFLVSESFFISVAPTTLSVTTSIGAVSIDVGDTTNFPTTGKLYIGGDVVTYTGKTATTFTGVTGISFAFTSGTEVSAIYDLPGDYASPVNVIYDNRVKLDAKLYDDIFEELNDYKGTNYNDGYCNNSYNIAPFYSIKDGLYMIVYGINNSGYSIKLRYEKTPTTMTVSVGPIIDNDIYAQTTIPYIAIGEMLFNRGEEQRAGELLNFGLGKVRELYNYYNKKSFEQTSGVHYKTGKGKLNI